MLNHKITRSLNQPAHKPRYPSLLRVLLLASFVLPLSVTAGVYKWVDEEGNVHYGSQRPENMQAEKLNIQSEDKKQPYPHEDKTADKAAKSPEPGNKETAAEPAKAQEPEQPKEPVISRKEKKRLCEAARQRVASIESRGRLKTTDEKGNVRHLTDNERMGRLKEARADVSKNCR